MVKTHLSVLLTASLFLPNYTGQALASNTPGHASDAALNGLQFSRLDKSASLADAEARKKLRLSLPSFSAFYQHRHEPSQTLLDEARVLYSEEGVRVEQVMENSGNVFIVNYAQEKFWFIDRQRQVFHAVPVVIDNREITVSPLSLVDSSAGFLQFSPCGGLNAIQGDASLWQGRQVQHWSCQYEGEVVEEQWFSNDLGLVLRSTTGDGFVSELTDIRKRTTRSENFQPPSDFRGVSISELMDPATAISTYTE